MSNFINAIPLGGYNNANSFLGPVATGGGNFQPTNAVGPGTTVLVAVTIQGGNTVAASGLTVSDTKGNSYTLLAQLNFGGNLLAVFGSVLTTLLSEQDYIAFQNSGYAFSACIGLAANNTSLTVDFTETNTGTGATPTPLTSGTPNATYGDAIFGFTGFASGFGFTSETGDSAWDTPLTGLTYSFNQAGSGSSIGVFGSETYSKSAQTYTPASMGESATFGNIVIGLQAVPISGTWASVERPDHVTAIGVTHADPIPPQLPGPFYFAYVDDDSVQFDPNVHNVMDEDIFSFEIKHDEGQVPTANIVIKNPRVGLLNPTRKQWAYLSYQTASGIVPIFFGILVGIPSDFFAELITLQFNARSSSYIEQKQAVAETLKVAPYYDPVFLDLQHRDEPDAILEGWSSLYHVDRTTLDVSASDILEGEDGTITFTESEGFYDSVKMSMGECPLYNVQVQADVKWTQRCIGYITGPSANIQSYTGGSFKADWPKPGASLGGGWKVESSYVWDVLDTEHARTFSTSFNWKNNRTTDGDCSTATISYHATFSGWPGIGIEGSGARSEQIGVCAPLDAGFVDENGKPIAINIPAKITTSGTTALIWMLNCWWTLRYDAKRDFNELAVINITANLQQTFVSPTVAQATELIKISGADVGLPLETPEAWSDYAGKFVQLGTLIFPNDPSLPGGTSYQMCVGSGYAGDNEPVFSDIPGQLTNDGNVVWASLGESPPQTQPQWTPATPVATGEIFVIEPKLFSTETGDMQTTGASYFFLCIRGGTTNGIYTSFEYLAGVTSSDQTPALPVPFAVILGPGDQAHSNIGGGGDGAAIPSVGGTTIDGSVEWVNLGTSPPFLGIPLGGTMTNVTARSYFPTPRGQQSLEYLICKARARLRMRARAVKIEWDAPFDNCLGLSCRHNATLYDPRLPGGAATGKVISYTLSQDKEGKLMGHVEIGVSVGYANSVPAITGTPGYTAATGYMEAGYQAYEGGQYTTAEEDIAYTPPVFSPYDDGLSFPLQFFPGTLTITHPIQNAQLVTKLAAQGSPQLGNLPAVTNALKNFNAPGSQTTIMKGQSAVDWLLGGQGTYEIECDPVAAEVLIDSVTNGPFNGAYYITVSQLELPQGINLAAGSSP